MRRATEPERRAAHSRREAGRGVRDRRAGEGEERLRGDEGVVKAAGPLREAPFGLGVGPLGDAGPRARFGDATSQVFEAVSEPEIVEEPGEARGGAGGKRGEPLEGVGEGEDVVALEAARRERHEGEGGAAGGGAREAAAGRAEEGEVAASQLREERRLLARRVPEEDGAGVERRSGVDRAEDLPDGLARLRRVGRRDDDGRGGRG
jgi:hypothetical protein